VALPEAILRLSPAKEHHGGFWNAVPFADLVLGIAGGYVLFFLAKRVMKPLLLRPEDHYGEGPE